MYDSGVKVKDFLDSVEKEADISIEIPRDSMLRWLSAVEQFAYTEVLKEFVSATLDLSGVPSDTIRLESLPVPDGAAAPVYDDVVAVYGENGQELQKAGAVSVFEFPENDLFYTDYNGGMLISTREEQAKITIIYRIRPAVKTRENDVDLHVALPPEYLDMAAAKIRGEAYKIANEDQIAAKWLADYNQQMENFKVWAAGRNERFGV